MKNEDLVIDPISKQEVKYNISDDKIPFELTLAIEEILKKYPLGKDQKDFIRKACKWYFNTKDKQYFNLAGYAGTGKSYCVKIFIECIGLLSHQVNYATFTGKAALVLIQKGIAGTRTIHKLIYDTQVLDIDLYQNIRNPDDVINEVKYSALDETERKNYVFKETISEIITKLKTVLDNPDCRLIVIDEFSMVDDNMIKDIESFGIKVLYLGDVGQVKPVGNIPNTRIDKYDHILTEIFRQSGEDNKIVDYSMIARTKGVDGLPIGERSKNAAILEVSDLDELYDFEKALINAEQIICCTNKTRMFINQALREILGHDAKDRRFPVVGEKIIITENNWNITTYSPLIGDDVPIINGTVCYVKQIRHDFKNKKLIMTLETSFDKDCVFKDIEFEMCDYDDTIKFTKRYDKDGNLVSLCRSTFGYCITVHKSQGSEYKSVLFLYDGFGDKDSRKALLYTGITRAGKKLVLFIYNPQRYYYY